MLVWSQHLAWFTRLSAKVDRATTRKPSTPPTVGELNDLTNCRPTAVVFKNCSIKMPEEYQPVLPLFSWRPTYQGCVFSPTFPYRTNYKLQCSTFCAAPVCRSRVTRRVLSGAKDHGDFLKGGGGGEDIHKPPPPLDIVRVTSPALRKIEKRPHS